MYIILLAVLIVIGVIYFLSYQKLIRQNRDLAEDFNRLVEVVENTKDLIYYYQIKPHRQFKYLSPSAEKLYGKGAIERAYANPDAVYNVIHPEDYDTLHKKIMGEINYDEPIIQRWKNREDNKYRWTEEYTTPIYKNGELAAIQGVIRNIDEKMALQQELEYRIHHDLITGIYNRDYFEQKFIAYNSGDYQDVSIVICDLDGLKATNDQKGHKHGDKLIKEAAEILNSFSSDSIIVSRIGGDEFTLLT